MKNISPTEKMMMVSLAFTMALLSLRWIYTGTPTYRFFAWNLFLAVVPYLISKYLLHFRVSKAGGITLFMVWMLFFPNAPYIITDLIHFRERLPVPKWYDLLIVSSALWNGLLLGILSLLQIERYLSERLTPIAVRITIGCLVLATGYGIYLGRFLRYNSWDALTNPLALLQTCAAHCLQPFAYQGVWKFTLLFATLIAIAFYTIRQLLREPLLAGKRSPDGH